MTVNFAAEHMQGYNYPELAVISMGIDPNTNNITSAPDYDSVLAMLNRGCVPQLCVVKGTSKSVLAFYAAEDSGRIIFGWQGGEQVIFTKNAAPTFQPSSGGSSSPTFYTYGIGSTKPMDRMLTDADNTPISYEQACAAGINVIIQDKSNPDDVAQFRPIKMQIFSSYVSYWVIDPAKNIWVLNAGSVS